MNEKMEKIISKDLNMSIDEIRNKSWNELEKIPRKNLKRAFRPANSFTIRGNINLMLNREMGTTMIEIRGFLRGIICRMKCLRRSRKNV